MSAERVAEPPVPFNAADSVVLAGQGLYRVHNNTRTVTDFNPGSGPRTRFAFFGDPVVPVLYSATSEEAAVAESLLHDIPLSGGVLRSSEYRERVLSRFTVRRDMRLASLHGLGLRRLNVSNSEVVDIHGPGVYERTVAWAEAAHDAGFDGVEWMSSKCNNARAQVLFGDRISVDEVVPDPDYGRAFLLPEHFDWLVDMCAPLRVEVLPPI